MTIRRVIVLLFAFCVIQIHGFLPSRKQVFSSSFHPAAGRVSFVPPRPVVSLLSSSRSSNDDENSRTTRSEWRIPNDFRTFLNQCTIQSFLFLVRQMRDVQTVKWLEDYTQPVISWRISELAQDPDNYVTGEFVEPDDLIKKRASSSDVLRYHGLAMINMTLFPTWDTYFLELIKKDVEYWNIVSTQAHIPNYELEINPASLCTRMISVREQIAREWISDLEVIRRSTHQVMDSYWETLRKTTAAAKSRSRDGSSSISSNRNDAMDVTTVRIERPNLLYLEWDPNEDSDVAPSPLRKGNFDLLSLMTLQEAIHRVLNHSDDDDDDDSCNEANYKFLETFYEGRYESHFAGAQQYGQAECFLEELLATPPSVMIFSVEESCIKKSVGRTSLMDTMHIAETILKAREQVCMEWKEIAKEVPTEHFVVRRMMLNKLMGVETTRENGPS